MDIPQIENIEANILNTKLNAQQTKQATTQIQTMIDQGYDSRNLEKKYYEIEKQFKETLLQYMPVDRAIKFIETIASMKRF